MFNRYIQIIAIQLKDEDQDIDTTTDEKYATKNIDKDYETKEKGQTYITAEFDYGETKFSVGDEKQYSRSKEGRKTTITLFFKLIHWDSSLREPVINSRFLSPR